MTNTENPVSFTEIALRVAERNMDAALDRWNAALPGTTEDRLATAALRKAEAAWNALSIA